MNSIPRKTKILATLGPASDSPEAIEELIRAGVNGFRLNFSHGSYDYFRPLIPGIRAIAARLNTPVALLQDLQGPKIRTGVLEGGTPVQLIPGAKFVITTREIAGNQKIVSTTYTDLPKDVCAGDKLLIDDGSIELNVVNVQNTEVETEILIGGLLKEKKGINLPGIKVSAPSMTEKDIQDAVFGAEADVDYIALSFVRTAEDVRHLKELLLGMDRPHVKVIAKIEKPEALENLKEILDTADGLMVARGDLGVEMPAGKLPLIQKMIIENANKAEKLVITATQMLESMVDHAKPTRAEASDVANAILDGTDVVMLSQETAVGKHPLKAVKMMDTIARYTEEDEGAFAYTDRIRPQQFNTFTHAIVHSAWAASKIIAARAILVFTQSGLTAELASCQRPWCPIYAFTPLQKTFDQLSLVWGVTPFLLETAVNDLMARSGEDLLLERKCVKQGDSVVVVSGTQASRGATNMMKMERVGD